MTPRAVRRSASRFWAAFCCWLCLRGRGVFCVDKRAFRVDKREKNQGRRNARADRPRHSLDTGLPVLDGERLDEGPDVGVEGGVARLVEGLHLLEARVEAKRRARLARRREVQVVAI